MKLVSGNKARSGSWAMFLVSIVLICFGRGAVAAHVGISVESSRVTYNDSSITTKVVTLGPLAAIKLDATNIPRDVKYVIFEAHHQKHNITMAYTDPSGGNLPPDQQITGRDIGLSLLLSITSDNASVWLYNPDAQRELLVLTVVALHNAKEPLPGGCNMEFQVEVSPYMKLTTSNAINTVEFQHGRIGSPRGSQAASCDTSFVYLSYELYAYFLAENDYSEEEYFRGVSLMSDVSTIKSQATRVKPLAFNAAQRTRATFMSYPGRGVIYSVIVAYENYEAAYVPVGTYNCDFSYGIEACGKLNSIPSIIIVTAAAAMGLMVCLKGHSWFELQMIFFGFIGASIPTFVLVAKFTALKQQERDLATLVVGCVGALIWVMVWRAFKIPLLSLLVSGCVLGLLIVSSILFTTLGNDNLFRSDLNYWMIIGCGCVILPLILLPFGMLLSVFASAIVGSYAVVFAADRFVGGSVAYILLNVLKRAIYDNMFKAANEVPLQGKDIVLLVLWAILTFFGLSIQLYSSLDKPSFPNSRSSAAADQTSERRARSSSRSRTKRSSKRKSRVRRRTSTTVPIDDLLIVTTGRRSGQLRVSVPPTETADESQPLLYVVETVPSAERPTSYHAI